MSEEEIAKFKPAVVLVNEKNDIEEVRDYI
jgi:aspartate 1-decarboxylase